MAAKLRLLQFTKSGIVGEVCRVGVELEGGLVVDVTAVDPSIPKDMKTFLQEFDNSAAAAVKYEHSYKHTKDKVSCVNAHAPILIRALHVAKPAKIEPIQIISHLSPPMKGLNNIFVPSAICNFFFIWLQWPQVHNALCRL